MVRKNFCTFAPSNKCVVVIMRRLIIIVSVVNLFYMGLYAVEAPIIWHCSDSLITIPTEDTISWADDYTVFAVLRSLHKDSSDCLWSIMEDDTVVSAVLTDGVYLRSTGILHSHSSRDFSKWCIYAYHTGIRLDSTKNHTLRLGEQIVLRQDSSGLVSDTLHARIETEEFAYFGNHVLQQTSAMFQTYLALKYGITLDHAPYLSSYGDTLWHPLLDEDYYHRIIGIGNDTVHGWQNLYSCSKEDAALLIATDTLKPNEYILLGDDGGDMEWRHETIEEFAVHRQWRLRTHTRQPLRLTAVVQLPSIATGVRMTVRSELNGQSSAIRPDSVHGDSICYFTLTNLDSITHLSVSGIVLDPLQNRNDRWNDIGSDNRNISYDPQTGTVVIDGYPENQLFDLYLYSATGQYITTLTSCNPVNVSVFPQTVAYVEIIADNQIVGAIPIPTNMY